jgi:hypothetical protein
MTHLAQQEVVADTKIDLTAKVDDNVAASTRASEARVDTAADLEALVVTPPIRQRGSAMTR